MRARISDEQFTPVIENASARGRIILVCEHASNHIPAAWGDLGLTAAQRNAHIAWDPGALGLARGLSQRLDATLIHAPVSRLVYDCNRAPDMPGAMPPRSEVHDIPGNADITPAERLRRTEAIYLPFHNGLHGLIMQRVALGLRPVIVTIHSFTPVYHGKPRRVEFGIIHDADPGLAQAIHRAARGSGLAAELNEPYSAVDDVTHTLRVAATPYDLPNAMLEIRNDLIADEQAETAMADLLAPIISTALIDKMNYGVGRFAMYLLFALMAILMWSSISKAFFNPSLWTLEMAQFVMVAYYVLGGPYAMQLEAHVRMDLFYAKQSPKRRAIWDGFTVFVVVFYMGVLIWGAAESFGYSLGLTWVDGWPQIGRLERSPTAWRPYLWPIKLVMLVGFTLMLLQAVSAFIRDIATMRGETI